MIRITMTEDGTSVLLRVEGRIVDEWVDLLDDTCRDMGNNGIGLILDLSGVTFASCAGLSVCTAATTGRRGRLPRLPDVPERPLR